MNGTLVFVLNSLVLCGIVPDSILYIVLEPEEIRRRLDRLVLTQT